MMPLATTCSIITLVFNKLPNNASLTFVDPDTHATSTKEEADLSEYSTPPDKNTAGIASFDMFTPTNQ
jgi:hypothetical protein